MKLFYVFIVTIVVNHIQNLDVCVFLSTFKEVIILMLLAQIM